MKLVATSRHRWAWFAGICAWLCEKCWDADCAHDSSRMPSTVGCRGWLFYDGYGRAAGYAATRRGAEQRTAAMRAEAGRD